MRKSKVYLIYDGDKSYCGFSYSKKDIEEFVKVRGKDRYRIIKVDTKDTDVLEATNLVGGELTECYHTFVFDEEETDFYEFLDDFMKEVEETCTQIKLILQYIKLDDTEEAFIIQTMDMIFDFVVEYYSDGEGEVDVIEFENYIKMKDLLREFITNYRLGEE